jgi:hypothetical protein
VSRSELLGRERGGWVVKRRPPPESAAGWVEPGLPEDRPERLAEVLDEFLAEAVPYAHAR